MLFKIFDYHTYDADPNVVYLVNDNWDDWFEFETVYRVFYRNSNIGNIKIGKMGQTERRAPLPSSFDRLPDDYFSLGVSTDYYASLKRYNERVDVLCALNDIAYNLDLFKKSLHTTSNPKITTPRYFY